MPTSKDGGSPWGEFPFGELLGIRHVEYSSGHSIVSLKVQKKHLNPMNTVHGAVTFALADTGMALALYTSLSQGESLATLEIKITYLNPGKTGVLHCSTTVLHKGRRFAMLESEIMQEKQLIAKASGIYAMYLAKTQTE